MRTMSPSGNQSPDSPAEKGARRGSILALVLVCAVMAIGWLVVFPALTRLAPVQRHIHRLEEARIDPSAMYYTELEMMGDVRQTLRDFRRDHPQALWSGELSHEQSRND